jgi:hypothetical protein
LFLLGTVVAAITFTFMAAMSCDFVSLSVTKDMIRQGIANNKTLPPLLESPNEEDLQTFVNGTSDRQRMFRILQGSDATNETDVSAPTIPPFVVPVLPTEAPVSPPLSPTDLPVSRPTDASMLDSAPPSVAPSSSPTTVDEQWATFSFGLFVYQDPMQVLLPGSPNDDNDAAQVCNYYRYEDDANHDQLPTQFRLARLGISIAIIAGLIAALIIVIEFLLCRVFCSRVLINLGSLTAILSIPLTFVMFADSRCNPLAVVTNDDGQQVGGCSLGDGAEEALIAGALWLVTFILGCVLPKPQPLVRVIRDMERNDRFAFCCLCCDVGFCARLPCCHKKQKHKKGYSENDALGDMELMMPFSTKEQVTDTQGHCYKQYHDETAGYTLQNQLTAAYKRWLDLEADYEAELFKFKEECKDAGVSWRKFLLAAKRASATKDSAASTRHADGMYTDEEATEDVPKDEEMEHMLQDDELTRLVGVLLTIRRNCDFAQGVMGRIQNEINEFTDLEDARRRKATVSSDTSVISGNSSSENIQSVQRSHARISSQRIKAQSMYASAKSLADTRSGLAHFSSISSNAEEDVSNPQPLVSETNLAMLTKSDPGRTSSATARRSKIGSLSELGSLSRIQTSSKVIASSPTDGMGSQKDLGRCNQM